MPKDKSYTYAYAYTFTAHIVCNTSLPLSRYMHTYVRACAGAWCPVRPFFRPSVDERTRYRHSHAHTHTFTSLCCHPLPPYPSRAPGAGKCPPGGVGGPPMQTQPSKAEWARDTRRHNGYLHRETCRYAPGGTGKPSGSCSIVFFGAAPRSARACQFVTRSPVTRGSTGAYRAWRARACSHPPPGAPVSEPPPVFSPRDARGTPGTYSSDARPAPSSPSLAAYMASQSRFTMTCETYINI